MNPDFSLPVTSVPNTAPALPAFLEDITYITCSLDIRTQFSNFLVNVWNYHEFSKKKFLKIIPRRKYAEKI